MVEGVNWPSGSKVFISIAKCGAIETIRRSNRCLKPRLCGVKVHKLVAEWEAQFTVNVLDTFQACPNGHPYNEDNTYWTKTNMRKCSECDRSARRERYGKAKAA